MLHKAATPESTVHNVRSILHEQDIFTIEYWVNNRDLPSSVRVNVHDIIPMGTNGKGRNYPFALASGYGEFLERLQNLILFDETSYIGNQDVKPLCHGDSKEYRFSYYLNSHPHTLSSLVNHIELDDLERIFGQSNQKDIEGISFLSLTSGKQVILPSPALYP